RIKIEGALQPASRFFMTTGKQIENSERGMSHRVALIGGDRLASGFPEPRVRLGRPITPAEHRLEMPSKGQIAECHRIRRIQGDGIVQKAARSGQGFAVEAAE